MVKSTGWSPRGLGSVPSTHITQLTTLFNSHLLNALFWPPCTHGTHIYRRTKHTYTQKKKMLFSVCVGGGLNGNQVKNEVVFRYFFLNK